MAKELTFLKLEKKILIRLLILL